MIEDRYKKIMERAKKNLAEINESIFHELYCDHLPSVEDDTEMNVKTQTEYALRDIIAGSYDVTESTVLIPNKGLELRVHLPAHVLKDMYESHREHFENSIIEDLKKTIKSLQDKRY